MKILKHGLLMIALTGLVTFALPAAPAVAQTSVNLQKMLEYNNAERNARGIRALSRNSTLDAEAQRWAEKLAAEGDMYHRPSVYALSVGFRSGAENLAWHDTSISASQAHNMWMASSTHRRNMLDPAFHAAGFGIACSTKSGRPYAIAVVEFGGDSPPTSSTPPAKPQVAGGQSMAGVGCSGADREPPPQPAPAAVKSGPPPPPKAPATSAPAKLPQKQGGSPSPSLSGGKTSPSATPGGSDTIKPSPPGSDIDNTGEATVTGTSLEERPPNGQTDASSSDPRADAAKLAAARSPERRNGALRVIVTALAAGLAYLFLIRIFGMKPLKGRRPRHYSSR